MNIHCPICDNQASIKTIGNYRYTSALFRDTLRMECMECRAVFVHPMPSLQQLNDYYSHVWLIDNNVVSTTSESEFLYRLQADERIAYLKRHITLKPDLKVLDIGSGYGCLYDAFKQNVSERIEFHATDPSKLNQERLKSKHIKTFSSLNDIHHETYDIITLCFVLEHISTPISFLKKVRSYLKKDGYMFIDVPERDDIFKKNYEPHVFFYSQKSLKNLFDKVNLSLVHCTGYGLKQEEARQLFSTNEHNTIRMKPIMRKLKSIVSKIKNESLEHKQRKNLYDTYQLDQEGDNRWWVRCIVQP
ncbi:MAG: methyltransferase domain-containing protein [Elusimicrobia bacterium]|nr:methyltransferase domain-containing protein [Elusimicrobiota bacterium]